MKTVLVQILLFILCLLSLNSCSKMDEASYQKKKNIELVNKYLERANSTSRTKEDRINDAEKANSLLGDFENGISKSEKLIKISKVYLNLNDSIRFKKSVKNTIVFARSISDSASLAFIYNRLAFYHNKKNNLDSVYSNYNKAEKIYSKLSDKFAYDHGKSLLGMAIVQRKIKDYSQSTSTTFKAIKRFQSSKKNINNYLSTCYSNLGIVFNNLENYDKAIEYHNESILQIKNMKSKDLRKILALNNIGVVLINQKKYLDALESFNRALGYKEYLKKDPKRRALLLDNLAYTNFLLRENNTLEQFLEALRIRDSIDDKIGIATSNLHLAEYYEVTGDGDKVIFHAKKAEKIAQKFNINKSLFDVYIILSKTLNIKENLKYANKYIKLNDSLIKEERIFRDKFAMIEFETEEKEEQIKQGKQKISEVQNQNTIYFLGIILLITFIGFLIYFSRQRNRYLAQQNKIVEFQAAYETETRISKRLHDEIGNDIFQVMMQYQNDPHDPQITKKLNTAYTKARDISRENSEFEVDESYPLELRDMLQNYTKNNIRLVLRGIEKITWDTMDKNLKITIYRVLQELMTNMQKHSQADLVAIVFKNEKKKLIIKYSDNGVGIEKEGITSKNGLRNTEKRIQAINGTIIFDSEKNKGFKAEIVISG